MRWFFALLLLINGIYYGFQNFMVEPGVGRVAVSVNKVELGQPVVLLSESGSIEVEAPVVAEVKVQEAESEPVCWMIGPFKEQVSAKQVQGRLLALDIKFALQEVGVPSKPDYWVHIPPHPSRKLALRVLRELQLKKIDSFLITEGELANGISLGLFSDRSRADRLFLERKKQGLEVDLREVPRVYTELWLLSEQGEYGKLSDLLWEKIKQGHSGVERQKNYCNAIASPENLH